MKQAQALAPWISPNMFYRGGDRNSQLSSYQLNPLLQRGETVGVISEANWGEKQVTFWGGSAVKLLSPCYKRKMFLAWLHVLA